MWTERGAKPPLFCQSCNLSVHGALSYRETALAPGSSVALRISSLSVLKVTLFLLRSGLHLFFRVRELFVFRAGGGRAVWRWLMWAEWKLPLWVSRDNLGAAPVRINSAERQALVAPALCTCCGSRTHAGLLLCPYLSLCAVQSWSCHLELP